MTILTQLADLGTIGALLVATPAVVYLFSAKPDRRARALRVLRLLLRR
ncbi:hypothetical protein [Planotetraspora sp. GP83]